MPFPAFRHRNFTLLWAGLFVSNCGTWMQNVAQSWLIYKMTGNDPIYLGLLGLSFGVPMTIAPAFGGVVVDRVDRVRLLYFTQTASLLLAIVLALLTWTGAIRPAHILTTTLLGALLLAFDNPARQSLVADLVPRDVLQNALSLNSATFTGAALLGPAMAGPLLDVVGAGWLFFINALSFLAVLFALFAMTNVPKHAHAIPSLRDALFGGFAYVAEHAWVRWLLVLSAVSGIFARSYQQLLPVFADGVLRGGPGSYGALLSGGGAGALVGALTTASVKDIRGKGRVMLVAGFALAGLLVAFALARGTVLAVGLVVAVGACSTVFTTMIATMIQLAVPGPLRGRVISLYAATLIGLPSLGSLAVAALAKALREGNTAAWTRPIRAVLDAIGVGGSTADLGVAAGAPRAIVVGAIVFGLVLAAAVPRWARREAS